MLLGDASYIDSPVVPVASSSRHTHELLDSGQDNTALVHVGVQVAAHLRDLLNDEFAQGFVIAPWDRVVVLVECDWWEV